MSKLEYNELKVGTIFTKNEDVNPYKILEYAFIRMQQRKPVVQLKIKNLISGKVLNYTAHPNESFEETEIELMPAIFIYHKPTSSKKGEANGEYWFYELGNPKNRFSLADDVIGNIGQFLKPDTEIKAYKFGNKFIDIELPVKMEFVVTEAPPAIKGNTAQGGTKLATIETGTKINVPLFINEGDTIRINTQTGEYAERVEKA